MDENLSKAIEKLRAARTPEPEAEAEPAQQEEAAKRVPDYVSKGEENYKKAFPDPDKPAYWVDK